MSAFDNDRQMSENQYLDEVYGEDFKERTRVFSSKKVIVTLHLFQYGKGYRLQETRVANDINYSRRLAGVDIHFDFLDEAVAEFDRRVQNVERKWQLK